MRFNFLSTVFSHSKGAKAVSNRLCAKTVVVSPGLSRSSPGVPEICFCRVKLFRDHEAEGKPSNDIAHVRETVEKLKQRVIQAETRLNSLGKRKRNKSIDTEATPGSVQGKCSKVQGNWSTSFASSAEGQHLSRQTPT